MVQRLLDPSSVYEEDINGANEQCRMCCAFYERISLTIDCFLPPFLPLFLVKY